MEVWGGNRATERCFQLPGMSISLYSHPYGHDSSGGDVYYLSSCAAGRLTRLLLADVSGHGSTVSGIAIGLRDLMRKNINRIRQTRFVRQDAHSLLCSSVSPVAWIHFMTGRAQ